MRQMPATLIRKESGEVDGCCFEAWAAIQDCQDRCQGGSCSFVKSIWLIGLPLLDFFLKPFCQQHNSDVIRAIPAEIDKTGRQFLIQIDSTISPPDKCESIANPFLTYPRYARRKPISPRCRWHQRCLGMLLEQSWIYICLKVCPSNRGIKH